VTQTTNSNQSSQVAYFIFPSHPVDDSSEVWLILLYSGSQKVIPTYTKVYQGIPTVTNDCQHINLESNKTICELKFSTH
jgi:hypothetical protein